ncbi:DUF6377 domain-containing protein [Sphingobacterium sp. DR205]|uniref:DUF6377 domain-containing protein n=1 Tax=Sphingobacterium sp. DR205 TaxID=2713573 RepID=UPI0013E4ED41|nr:DUF6377 domain-containing protein [Sphingobacterium sp. DR205]QIH35471.1 hypothetical protein G6053_22480 [Sphingobacterium sp. DR205]
MKKIILLVLLSIALSPVLAGENVDSLLQVLDKTIVQRKEFSDKKERELKELKQALDNSRDLFDKFNYTDKLFDAYKHYNLDSAIAAARMKLTVAQQLHDKQLELQSQMNIAEIMGKMGIYKETFDCMDKIDKSQLKKDQWGYYYHLYHSIYTLLFNNASLDDEKKQYNTLISRYKDSLLQVYDAQSIAYRLTYNDKLLEKGDFREALLVLKPIGSLPGQENAQKASIAYRFAKTYEKLGDVAEQKKYLALAALIDIRRAAKSYVALRELAVLLYEEGQVDRAYAYIRCAMEDASFARARFRMIEITEALPIIVASYDKKMEAEKSTLFNYLVLISVLSVILLASSILIYLQLKRISATKKIIKSKNDELLGINVTLRDLNTKLSESDHVKETYIGYVFNLCSSYINKLESYRVNLHKKLRAGQIQQALSDTGDTNLVSNEVKDFFQNFDAVFLSIYPRFITDFNQLLKPEEQIQPKSDDCLTPELRVFALMRMGIPDSSRIANFLHYSPQTVYNYKRKIMNKLVVNKEDFLLKMEQIGR